MLKAIYGETDHRSSTILELLDLDLADGLQIRLEHVPYFGKGM